MATPKILRFAIGIYVAIVLWRWRQNKNLSFGIRRDETMCPCYVEGLLVALFVYLIIRRLVLVR